MKKITKLGFIASMLCASFSVANAAVPAVAPPVPTYTADNVFALFADTYRTEPYSAYKVLTNWGGGIGSATFKATADEMETVMQISGMNNSTGYLAIQLTTVPPEIKANAYTYMHMDIFCNEATYFRFGMETWTPLTVSAMKIYAPTIKPTDMVPGKWFSIDLPMADFGGIPNGGLNILRFGNTENLEAGVNAADIYYSGEIYVANMYFFKGVPTCLGGKVISGLKNPVEQYSFNAYVANNSLKCSATESIKKLEIFSLTGQKVQSVEANDLSAIANISTLSNGVYFVSAKLSNGAVVSRRFIK